MKIENNYLLRQTGICADILRDLANTVLVEKKVLDLEVNRILRANKGWGSKDRKFYSEVFFCFFRFYGIFLQQFGEMKNWDSEIWQKIVLLCAEFSNYDISKAERNDFKLIDFVENWELFLPKDFAEIYGHNLPIKDFAKLQQSRAVTWIRICREKNVVLQELKEKSCQFEIFSETAIKIISKINFNELKSFQNGFFEIQDLASQEIGNLTNPQPKEVWLDFCCGAGGKSLQLSDLSNGKADIICYDIRLEIYGEVERRKRWRKNIKVGADFTETLFDGVLVDAPCSNSGTWRRNPALKWQEVDFAKTADLQLKILEKAAIFVKKAGVLVYSTCSVTKLENQNVVASFLAKNPNFILESERFIEASWSESDAMFAVKFRKTN